MTARHGGKIFEVAMRRGWDWREILDYSASINPLGPSPAVFDAIERSRNEIMHYPASRPADLLDALEEAWAVPQDRILLGNGATDLIHFLGSVYRDQSVTLGVPVFSEFHRAFPMAKQVSLDELPQDGGLTVVTRPVNPTGEVRRFRSNNLLVDESFIEFTGAASDFDAGIVLRSLTKFYALPGLRIGALVASTDQVARWQSLRDPWAVNVLAARAAAAAIRDTDHACKTLAVVRRERDWLIRELCIRGLRVWPSQANYLFIELPYPAATLTAFLEDRKILIRDCTGWPGIPGDRAVRIAVRLREQNERLIAAWKEFSCESC